MLAKKDNCSDNGFIHSNMLIVFSAIKTWVSIVTVCSKRIVL